MLQTVGGSGSIQVAQAGGTQQLQQIQVVPASGLQVSFFVYSIVLFQTLNVIFIINAHISGIYALICKVMKRLDSLCYEMVSSCC